jgi:recombination protein RecA
MITDQKKNALQAALQQIRKSFGAGAVQRLGGEAQTQDQNMEVIPTGSLGLDLALGVGGFPTGRIVEIYGPESSGKTTLALQTIAQAQKMGETCAFIDVEHAFDPVYAKKLGIVLDDLYVSQPDTGEQALEIVDTWVASGAMKVIVVDSVAALVPKAELEGDMGDSHMGLQARLMSQALRKLTGSISRSKSLVIFINQVRHKIGVMFGSPETTTGGNALKFYASIRLDIRRIGNIKEKDQLVGSQTRVKVVKNKVAPPFQEALFNIMYGEGVSKVEEIIDLGTRFGILEKSGSWYGYHKKNIGQGKEAVKEFFLQHPKQAQEIEDAIKKAVQNKGMFDAVVPVVQDPALESNETNGEKEDHDQESGQSAVVSLKG